MKELNEMSLKDLFELQKKLGKDIEKRVQIGEEIRKRRVDSAIENCIEEIPQLIQYGVDKWSDYKKDERDLRIKMSNRALLLLAFLVAFTTICWGLVMWFK